MPTDTPATMITAGAAPAPSGLPRLAEQARTIARLGAPLIAFNFIFNAVDLVVLAMLGRLGNTALAGVGAASAVYGVVLALLFGIDAGVQAITSRTTCAGRQNRLGEVLADAMAVGVPLAALLAALLWFAGPMAVTAIAPGKAAALAGSAWIRAAAPSLVFSACTIPINSCWIGSGRPAIAFTVTALLAPIQVLLALLLMFGFGPVAPMGASGGAAAMSLAALVGIGVQFALAWRIRPIPGFLRSKPRLAGMAAIARIGWPVSAQQSLAQLGLMIAFIIVSQLGVASAAVVNVLLSLTLVTIQSGVGLGIAAATLVGQALGRGDPAAARAWGWRATWGGVWVTAPLGLIAAAMPHHVLGLFLRDPTTLALAVWPVRALGLAVGIDTVGRVLAFALRGAGATKIASGLLFLSLWAVQLPVMWWIGVRLGQGINGVIMVQVGISVIDAVVLMTLWRGTFWTRVRINEAAPVPAR
jgi:MATE family multidrug resistance protein